MKITTGVCVCGRCGKLSQVKDNDKGGQPQIAGIYIYEREDIYIYLILQMQYNM